MKIKETVWLYEQSVYNKTLAVVITKSNSVVWCLFLELNTLDRELSAETWELKRIKQQKRKSSMIKDPHLHNLFGTIHIDT